MRLPATCHMPPTTCHLRCAIYHLPSSTCQLTDAPSQEYLAPLSDHRERNLKLSDRDMGNAPTSDTSESIRGKIIEAEIKVSVDPGHPLPLACALYAIEAEAGVWLCAYYGANRSVFDYLPQKGAEVDESRLGISFHVRQWVPKDEYQPSLWDEFKKARWMTFEGHGG
jgi:hypothetical protein